ncbi:MAG: type II toxin-antitoxin system PemK/MazF family toxin, partial [Haloarculaceae archaeon]
MTEEGKEVVLRRGDIVTVRPGPADGQEMEKLRPALVVQTDVGNEHSSTTIVAPTTGTDRGYPFEVRVEAGDSPFETDSSIRLDQIRVVSIGRRIHSVVGTLDCATMDDVDQAMKGESVQNALGPLSGVETGTSVDSLKALGPLVRSERDILGRSA